MLSLRPIYVALLLTTLLLTFIFWLAHLFSLGSYRCLWLEEYYWISDGSYVSLYPALMFSFLLLGWWNICIPLAQRISGEHPTRIEWVALSCNGILLSVVGLVFWALWGWVEFDNYRKYGVLPTKPKFVEYFPGENKYVWVGGVNSCVASDRLVGVWKNNESPDTNNQAGFSRILLWRDGSYEKYDDQERPVEEGFWQTASWNDFLVFSNKDTYQFWKKELSRDHEGESLMLTPFRQELWENRTSHVMKPAKPIRLKLIERPYNSTPQNIGQRVVSPSSTDTGLRYQMSPPNPDAVFP